MDSLVDDLISTSLVVQLIISPYGAVVSCAVHGIGVVRIGLGTARIFL